MWNGSKSCAGRRSAVGRRCNRRVIQIVTRHDGAPVVNAEIEGGSRASAAIRRSTTGEVGAGGGKLAAITSGTMAIPHRPNGIDRGGLERRQSAASGMLGAGWRGTKRHRRLGTFRHWTPTAIARPYGSVRRDAFPVSIRISRGVTERHTFGARLVQPWEAGSSRIRQRVDFDVAELDSRLHHSLRLLGVGDAPHARPHPDRHGAHAPPSACPAASSGSTNARAARSSPRTKRRSI